MLFGVLLWKGQLQRRRKQSLSSLTRLLSLFISIGVPLLWEAGRFPWP